VAVNIPAKAELLDRLALLPRVRLAQTPTPLVEMKRLSSSLGGPRILFKRDDLTGAGLGGNKVRKLEYVIGRALAEQADTLVVCGGFQSNLARIAAAMGSQLGLRVELVLGGVPGESRAPVGNLMLDHLYGANVRFVETDPRWDFGSALDDVMSELQGKGLKPYLIPLGASSPEGMASYIEASAELLTQFHQLQIQPDYLYLAVGSGGTYCGLMLAQKNMELPYQVVGVSVSRTSEYYRENLAQDMSSAAAQLGIAAPSSSEIHIEDGYRGDGYGQVSQGCNEAIALVASTEGILLDPVYSGKCMHGLIEHIRQGRIGKNNTVVFLHTGGWPALFSYGAEQLGLITASEHQPS
jgi:D-cysteine desulfhydrase/L-cysteate sulfo-lyase